MVGHPLKGDIDRLAKRIVSAAYDATFNNVEAFHEKEQAEKAAKQAGKTRNRILAVPIERGSCTPAKIANALGIARSTIIQAQGWIAIRSTR